MRRNAGAAVLVLGIALAAFLWWRSVDTARTKLRWRQAILAVADTGRGGWVETFDADNTMPLTVYDGRWRPLFGGILVHHRLSAAVGDPTGGWQQDGGDDYAFRAEDAPTGNVQITLDGWWDGHGSIGAQGAVQDTPPHRFYEAALWRGRLALIHFRGPTPDQFDVLAESAGGQIAAGFYRIVFCLQRDSAAWRLDATLRDPVHNYRVMRHVSARDDRLGPGVQGIGLLGGGGPGGSYITGISVREMPRPEGCGGGATP